MHRIEKDGLIFAAASVFAWGLTGIFVRLLPGFSGLLITGFRFLFAFAVTLPFVLLDSRRRSQILPTLRKPAAWSLGIALVVFYFLAVSAYQYGSVAEVALFLGTPPVFVIAGKALRGTPVKRREKIGAAVAMLGVALVLLPKLSVAQGFSKERLIGIALAILSAAASAHYTGLSRSARERNDNLDPTLVSLLAFAIGGFAPLATCVALGQLPTTALHGHALETLVALALISTALPSITYAVAAQKLPATVTATAQLMVPVVATIAAAAVLREVPSLWLIPGGALVLFGIVYMFREPAPVRHELPAGDLPEFAAGD